MPSPAAARALKSPFSSHPFAALMVANFCFFMGFATFFLLPKYLITELGAAEREVGLLMAGYGVSMIACLPWVECRIGPPWSPSLPLARRRAARPDRPRIRIHPHAGCPALCVARPAGDSLCLLVREFLDPGGRSGRAGPTRQRAGTVWRLHARHLRRSARSGRMDCGHQWLHTGLCPCHRLVHPGRAPQFAGSGAAARRDIRPRGPFVVAAGDLPCHWPHRAQCPADGIRVRDRPGLLPATGIGQESLPSAFSRSASP